MSETNTATLEETMPYSDKEEKALKIAKHLLVCNELQRGVELEVIAEDDKVLAEMVKNKLADLEQSQQQGPKSMVHTAEDVDKLPPGPREAIKHFIEQLGGIPPGGLFQVKLDSLDGMNTAVDTVMENGNLNLGTIVCSKLAAERAAQIAQSIHLLVEHGNKLKEKGKSTAEDQKVLKRIDEAIRRTFGEKDFKIAINLAKELLEKKPKSKAAAIKAPKLRK